jgi:hypothetical protein
MQLPWRRRSLMPRDETPVALGLERVEKRFDEVDEQARAIRSSNDSVGGAD